MRKVGINTAAKQAGIATIHTGIKNSPGIQRLSTATKISADKAWIGDPSESAADGAG